MKRHVITIIFIILASAIVTPLQSVRADNPEVDQLVAQAEQKYQDADYGAALDLLRQALEKAPDNARVYYLLGHYLHYLCYDSTPLSGYGRETSDQVLAYLTRAIDLDPGSGDARYFLGAEHGVRAREAIREGDCETMVAEFKAGRKAGGYPDWMIEYGRNLLESCPRDAILFVQGDAETNAVEFLRAVEQYRTDVTAIPVALMERPWFALMLKEGVPGCLRSVAYSWNRDQILGMRPYKWQTNDVEIAADGDSTDSSGTAWRWTVEPDLARAGEKPRFLSAGRALLVEIVGRNFGRRPVCFSMACPPSFFAGLEHNLQLRGTVQALTALAPASGIDLEWTASFLLDLDNFAAVPTVQESDMPRVSRMLQNYRTLFLRVARQYYISGEMNSARTIYRAMKTALPEEFLPIPSHLEGVIKSMDGLLEEEP